MEITARFQYTSLLRHFASTNAEFCFNVRVFIAAALSARIVFIKQNFFFLYKKRRVIRLRLQARVAKTTNTRTTAIMKLV